VRAHVTTVVRSCFAALRQIRSVWRSLPRHSLLTLVRALSSARWITAIQFLPACLGIFMIGCSQLSTPPPVWFSRPGGATTSFPLLWYLHWLRVPEGVNCRLCVLVYRCLHSMAPSYLADELQLTSNVGTCRQLHSADSSTVVVRSTRRSATAHFPWQLHAPGTASR